MKSRSELKISAKQALTGKILISFAIILIPTLIASLPTALFSKKEAAEITVPLLVTLFSTALSIALMPMFTGVKLYFQNVYRKEGDGFSNLIERYKGGCGWEIIKAKLLSEIYILIGLFLLIIPGIYLAFKYSMIDYIFADKKDIKYAEAMRESGEIMKGNKARLFVLVLSFIGWFFVGGDNSLFGVYLCDSIC